MDRTVFSSIEQALADIKDGKMVIVADDENRENECDLIAAGQFLTPQQVTDMAVNARGLICMPVSRTIAERLRLDPMTAHNTDNHCTAFTVSIDAVDTTTGISAFERCRTAQLVADPDSVPSDFRRPGHLFPLVAEDGGVLVRRGHTEATVDLCRLAGVREAGLCCEIMSSDGHMARLPEVIELSKKWGLHLITIEALVSYRRTHENHIRQVSSASLPTRFGYFTIYAFVNTVTGVEHAALVMGELSGSEPVLCRVHSQCVTGDTFGSLRCDCGQQLDGALSMIAREGRGVLLYLAQEGRGIGFANKIRAYHLQDQGRDTVDANVELGFPEDAREYSDAVKMLSLLGISRIRLITNNPRKMEEIAPQGSGICISERVPLEIPAQKYDAAYLKTKKDRMGHLLTHV